MMYLNNTFLLLFTLFSVLVFFYIFTQSSGYFKFLDSTFFIPFFHEVKDAFYLATTHLQISTVLQVKKKRANAPKPDTKTPKTMQQMEQNGERVPPTKAMVPPLGIQGFLHNQIIYTDKRMPIYAKSNPYKNIKPKLINRNQTSQSHGGRYRSKYIPAIT